MARGPGDRQTRSPQPALLLHAAADVTDLASRQRARRQARSAADLVSAQCGIVAISAVTATLVPLGRALVPALMACGFGVAPDRAAREPWRWSATRYRPKICPAL
jgi:hypothetical protein